MAQLNRVDVIGYLGADPDVRETKTGRKVATISVGVTERWKTEDGQDGERTEWIRVQLWGRLAEVSEDFLRKGSQVFVSGRMQTQKWTDDKGVDRWTTDVVARQIQMLDRRKGDNRPHPADSDDGDGVPRTGRAADDDIPY